LDLSKLAQYSWFIKIVGRFVLASPIGRDSYFPAEHILRGATTFPKPGL
jgi:hypothetical protein